MSDINYNNPFKDAESFDLDLKWNEEWDWLTPVSVYDPKELINSEKLSEYQEDFEGDDTFRAILEDVDVSLLTYQGFASRVYAVIIPETLRGATPLGYSYDLLQTLHPENHIVNIHLKDGEVYEGPTRWNEFLECECYADTVTDVHHAQQRLDDGCRKMEFVKLYINERFELWECRRSHRFWKEKEKDDPAHPTICKECDCASHLVK